MGLDAIAAELQALGLHVDLQRDLVFDVLRFKVTDGDGHTAWFSGEPEASGGPPYAVWSDPGTRDARTVANEQDCVRLVADTVAVAGRTSGHEPNEIRERSDAGEGILSLAIVVLIVAFLAVLIFAGVRLTDESSRREIRRPIPTSAGPASHGWFQTAVPS